MSKRQVTKHLKKKHKASKMKEGMTLLIIAFNDSNLKFVKIGLQLIVFCNPLFTIYCYVRHRNMPFNVQIVRIDLHKHFYAEIVRSVFKFCL